MFRTGCDLLLDEASAAAGLADFIVVFEESDREGKNWESGRRKEFRSRSRGGATQRQKGKK